MTPGLEAARQDAVETPGPGPMAWTGTCQPHHFLIPGPGACPSVSLSAVVCLPENEDEQYLIHRVK